MPTTPRPECWRTRWRSTRRFQQFLIDVYSFNPPDWRLQGSIVNDTPVQALPPGVTDAGRIDEYRGWNDRPLRYRMVRADSPRWSLTYLHGIESHSTWF